MLIEQQRVQSDAAHFYACLEKAVHHSEPFAYWLLENILPPPLIDALAVLPSPPAEDVVFAGRRENNNACRIYFSPAYQRQFPVCRQLVSLFSSEEVVAGLSACTGANLASGQLRIEYCQDTNGFWLEPHCDVPEKLFTMLIYISDDRGLSDAGTDIYGGPPEHRLMASAPYGKNTGLIFIPGANTWHGFSRRAINGLRKSLIINYVSAAWRATEELA